MVLNKVVKVKADYFNIVECSPLHSKDGICPSSECPAYRDFKSSYCAKCQCFYCTRGNCVARNK